MISRASVFFSTHCYPNTSSNVTCVTFRFHPTAGKARTDMFPKGLRPVEFKNDSYPAYIHVFVEKMAFQKLCYNACELQASCPDVWPTERKLFFSSTCPKPPLVAISLLGRAGDMTMMTQQFGHGAIRIVYVIFCVSGYGVTMVSVMPNVRVISHTYTQTYARTHTTYTHVHTMRIHNVYTQTHTHKHTQQVHTMHTHTHAHKHRHTQTHTHNAYTHQTDLCCCQLHGWVHETDKNTNLTNSLCYVYF